jgi:hypothetical protein
MQLTFVPAIIGPGKVPPARVALDAIARLDIVIREQSRRTHGRGNPSGAILSFTIWTVAPGPIEAETPPQTVARSKARERNRDIREQKARAKQNKTEQEQKCEMKEKS